MPPYFFIITLIKTQKGKWDTWHNIFKDNVDGINFAKSIKTDKIKVKFTQTTYKET